MKRVLLLFPVLVWLTAGGVMAGDREAAPLRVTGQRVMVPIYSHVFMGDRLTPFHVAATASIRNTDPDHPILILAADYHGSQGRKIRSFLSEARRLRPLASLEFNIPESDTTGGYGASFLIRWSAATPVSPPLIESVMIGTRGQQGISFTSRGVALPPASSDETSESPPLKPSVPFPSP